MAANFQTTFSNGFSWMKMYKFRLTFQWSFFLRVQLTIFQHWFRQWLGADQATSHYLNQWWLVYWRIYASLGLNELTDILLIKPLSHILLKRYMTYITLCGVIRSRWLFINSSHPSAAYMRQRTGSPLVKIKACRQFGAKPLPEPMLAYCQLDSWEHVSVKFEYKFCHFHSRKCNWECHLPKWRPFCPGRDELTDRRA